MDLKKVFKLIGICCIIIFATIVIFFYRNDLEHPVWIVFYGLTLYFGVLNFVQDKKKGKKTKER